MLRGRLLILHVYATLFLLSTALAWLWNGRETQYLWTRSMNNLDIFKPDLFTLEHCNFLKGNLLIRDTIYDESCKTSIIGQSWVCALPYLLNVNLPYLCNVNYFIFSRNQMGYDIRLDLLHLYILRLVGSLLNLAKFTSSLVSSSLWNKVHQTTMYEVKQVYEHQSNLLLQITSIKSGQLIV